MNKQLQDDLSNIDELLEKVKLQGLDYLKSLSERQTSTDVREFSDSKLNEIDLGGIDSLKLFNQ